MFKEDSSIDNNYTIKLKYKSGTKIVGKKESVLVNMLLGANSISEYNECLNKIQRIEKNDLKPDIISDLSTRNFDKNISVWEYIVRETNYIAATLPTYTVRDKADLNEEELIEIIQKQLEGGVGLITIHPTANRDLVNKAKSRITPITSRGGKIIINDMINNNRTENIYLSILDRIINLCRKHNCSISIGTTFRSANIIDACDEVHILEMQEQIILADYISKMGVGAIIEAPGHANPSKIIKACKVLNKSQYPIMPLGPIVTDIGFGMDHITSAIGATIMGMEGCVQVISAVTREEHTGNIPSIDSVVEAINTAKLTAHIIDIERKNDIDIDRDIAIKRKKSCVYKSNEIGCSRCGNLCPLIDKHKREKIMKIEFPE